MAAMAVGLTVVAWEVGVSMVVVWVVETWAVVVAEGSRVGPEHVRRDHDCTIAGGARGVDTRRMLGRCHDVKRGVRNGRKDAFGTSSVEELTW